MTLPCEEQHLYRNHMLRSGNHHCVLLCCGINVWFGVWFCRFCDFLHSAIVCFVSVFWLLVFLCFLVLVIDVFCVFSVWLLAHMCIFVVLVIGVFVFSRFRYWCFCVFSFWLLVFLCFLVLVIDVFVCSLFGYWCFRVCHFWLFVMLCFLCLVMPNKCV